MKKNIKKLLKRKAKKGNASCLYLGQDFAVMTFLDDKERDKTQQKINNKFFITDVHDGYISELLIMLRK